MYVDGASATGLPGAGNEAVGQVGVVVLHAGINVGHGDPRAVQPDARQPGGVAGVREVRAVHVVGRYLVAQFTAQAAVGGLDLDAINAGHPGRILECGTGQGEAGDLKSVVENGAPARLPAQILDPAGGGLEISAAIE